VVGISTNTSNNNSIPYKDVFGKSYSRQVGVSIQDDNPHIIVYTSGTTGRPKEAVLTHQNVYINGLTRKNSIQLLVAPIFHIAALSTLVQHCLTVETIHLHQSFQPQRVLATIEKEKIDNTFLIPIMWRSLMSQANFSPFDVNSIQICTTGGEITPPSVKKKILNLFPNEQIFEAFGQSEMNPSIIYLLPKDTLRKPNSVGRASMNVRIRVVDEQMNDVKVGEVGEIVYRGPTMMKE